MAENVLPVDEQDIGAFARPDRLADEAVGDAGLTIVGFEEGTGKNVGKLGALICEGVDNEKLIRVNVGSGFTDNDRDSYWSSRFELIGDVVEVVADAVTQNQDGSYSLRFPRFARFRGFEEGEKL